MVSYFCCSRCLKELSSWAHCSAVGAYSPPSFSSWARLNPVQSFVMMFADAEDHAALAHCAGYDTCCLCVVSDGKVSDLLVCQRPGDYYTPSLSGPFSSPQANSGALRLPLLWVIGVSVSKRIVVSTSWFRTGPGSASLAVPVQLSSCPLFIQSLVEFPTNPSIETRVGDIPGSQASCYCVTSAGSLSRLCCKLATEFDGTKLTQVISSILYCTVTVKYWRGSLNQATCSTYLWLENLKKKKK